MELLISKNTSGFTFKGDHTAAINWKEQRWREKKNAALELKQMERYSGKNKLVPNIGGTEFDSWKDAASAAKEAGIPTEGYQKKAEESKLISSSGINDAKWKAAKDKKNNA